MWVASSTSQASTRNIMCELFLVPTLPLLLLQTLHCAKPKYEMFPMKRSLQSSAREKMATESKEGFSSSH